MKFREYYEFDYDAETILRMFRDQSYYERKYEELAGEAPEILACDSEADYFSIDVRHVLDASNIKAPDMIKSRIGERIVLHQHDRWYLSKRQGRIDTDLENTPARLVIDMELSDQNGKSQLVLDFEITVDVPLIGGRIEKFLADPMTRFMHKDLKISNRMAAEYATGEAASG